VTPAALILAAGRSRRMGRPKPVLPLAGRTLLEWVLEPYRRLGAAPRVVVLGAGDRAAGAEAARLGAEVLVNREPGSEMFDSLRIGLRRLASEADPVLVQPADVPLAGLASIRSLWEGWRGSGAAAAIPTWKGRGGHPVLLGPAAVLEILDGPADRTLRDVLASDRLEVLRVPVEWEGIRRDCDRPEDLACLEELDGRMPDEH